MARKLGLTPRDVVDEAVALANAEGLDAVTLAAVADRLGVRSPSLYAHVAGLDGLRRALALRGAKEIERSLGEAARDRSGLPALQAIAHAYRAFALERPGSYAAAQRAVRPGEDDELYASLAATLEPVLRALAEAGVPEEVRIHLIRGFRSALHGFVELERAGGFGMPESVDESFERLVELLLAGIRSTATPG
jgi:AcrR family transcriptional regulator